MNKKDIQALQKGFKNFRDFILELCFPNKCILCKELCTSEICDKCIAQYPISLEKRCMCCSKFIKDLELEFCEDCIKLKKNFEQGGSLWKHEGKVQESIYRFKYKNHRIYAKEYGRLLTETYAIKLRQWKPQAIVAVPVHKSRQRKRGYNQAQLLVDEVIKNVNKGFGVNLKDLGGVLFRNKSTTFQKKLDNKQRVENIQGAFGIKKDIKLPERILIVDDIYTTGATLNELAKLLKKKGAKEVYFLAISIGQGF